MPSWYGIEMEGRRRVTRVARICSSFHISSPRSLRAGIVSYLSALSVSVSLLSCIATRLVMSLPVLLHLVFTVLDWR